MLSISNVHIHILRFYLILIENRLLKKIFRSSLLLKYQNIKINPVGLDYSSVHQVGHLHGLGLKGLRRGLQVNSENEPIPTWMVTGVNPPLLPWLQHLRQINQLGSGSFSSLHLYTQIKNVCSRLCTGIFVVAGKIMLVLLLYGHIRI